MGGASDEAVLDRAKHEGATVATLDADFHRILASTGAAGPSVIRVRIEGLGAQELADLLLDVVRRARRGLQAGAAVSVVGSRVRLRRLPLAK
jgi:predicted nuclease of predicted toxin-antitoxin system